MILMRSREHLVTIRRCRQLYISMRKVVTVPVATLTGEGSNAYLALIDALITYNANNNTSYSATASANSYVRSGSYYMMNENYGKIIGLFGLSNGDKTWSAKYWDGSVWEDCGKGLGYYKSVSDVPTAYKTSNIALVYGDATVTATPTNSILTVSVCKEFAVSFYIDTGKDLNAAQASSMVNCDLSKLTVTNSILVHLRFLNPSTGTSNSLPSNAVLI